MRMIKKIFATFTNHQWTSMGGKTEVRDEAEAVAEALKNHALYFETHEVEIAISDSGKQYKGDPENKSGRNYVGIRVENILSRDDVIKYFQAEFNTVAAKDNPTADDLRKMKIAEDLTREFAKDSSAGYYMSGLERPGEFTPLYADNKVFDGTGKQIYPKRVPPAPGA